MWNSIARVILRNKVTLLIILGLLTAFMGYHASFVELEYEYAQMLPEYDSAYIQYEDFKKQFGADANIMVAGFYDSTFFELEKFRDWRELSNSIKSIEGITNVVSLVNSFNLKKNTELKKFELTQVFPENIQSQEELDRMKEEFLKLPFYDEVAYNDSTHFVLLAITIAQEKMNSRERIYIVDSTEVKIREFAENHDIDLHFSGLPYTRTRIAEMIKSELNLFLILAFAVSAIILFLFFRSFIVVIFSMLVVGTGVVWALGSLTLFGYKITILTGLVPPVLIVIGIPNCVFLLNKYHQEFKSHGNKVKALQRMIMKIGNAIFLTNLTTAAGFATFIITNNRILVEFGIVASLNIFGVFLLSLVFIPAIFSFLPKPSQKHTSHLDNKIISRIVDILCNITTHHRKPMYVVTIILLLIGFYGISKMKTTGYIIDDIPTDDPIYVDLKFFEKNMGGVMPIEITIDTKKKKGILKPSVLKKMEKLQKRLATYPELSKSVCLVDAVKFARQAYFNGNPKHFKLPSNQERNFILSYAMKDANKSHLTKSFADSLGQSTRISLRVADIGTNRMKKMKKDIEMEIDSIFNPEKYNTVVTGSSIVYTKGTSYLIKNLFASLALAIVLIAFFMAWMFASWRMLLVSLIPNLFPLLMTAALMGYFGISVKPSTILVFSIAFGISVDNAIHFLAKYRMELRVTNWDIGKSVVLALKETGVSIMYTAIILFFGFGIFTISKFGGTAALGILVSITLLIAVLTNLVLLPSLLLTLEKSITTKAFKEPLLHIFDEEEDIELEDLKIETVDPDSKSIEKNE